MTKQILQFKITLNDVTPKIWRRIQVPSNYTFFNCEEIIFDNPKDALKEYLLDQERYE